MAGTARLFGLTVDGEVIGNSLVQRWADKPVAEIDGHDVYGIVEETRTKGVPGWATMTDGRPSDARAKNMFAALSSMFTWLNRHRRVELNPCAGVHRPEAPAARERVLTETEIVKFGMLPRPRASLPCRSCC